MKVIYEDNNRMVVFKPAGQLTQSNRSFDLDLVSEVITYRRKKGEEGYVAVINRLDRGVSGLVLIAKNKNSAKELSDKLRKHSIHKEYTAVVKGKVEPHNGCFEDYLLADKNDNKTIIVKSTVPMAKRARLNYNVVKVLQDDNGNWFTLVAIELITGRHHQIRAQFSNRGYSLFGDIKYDGIFQSDMKLMDEEGNAHHIRLTRNEIALCATALTVDKNHYECTPLWYTYQ